MLRYEGGMALEPADDNLAVHPAFRWSEPLEPVPAWHTIAMGLLETTYATGLFALSSVPGRVAALGPARGSGPLLQPEHQAMRP